MIRLPMMPVLRRLPLALAAAALLSCAAAGPALADHDLRVVVTIKPVHSLVSAVMAGVGEPHLIIRGAASPHTFNMHPSDAMAIADADVIFLIGDTMETALAGPVETLPGHADVVVLADAPGLILRPLREGGAFGRDDHHGHGHQRQDGHDDVHEVHVGEARADEVAVEHHDDHEDGPFDMHIWLDPINGWAMARTIADVLAEADPANEAVYEANTDGLRRRLDHLNEEIAAQVAPARGVPFIVFHDGYRYFEDRFGLTVVGSVVVSPSRPPGVRRISELRNKVQALDVTCVLAEPQFDESLVRTIVEGSEVATGTVDPLGSAIEDGPELYFTLLSNMAAAFTDCLAPGEGGAS